MAPDSPNDGSPRAPDGRRGAGAFRGRAEEGVLSYTVTASARPVPSSPAAAREIRR